MIAIEKCLRILNSGSRKYSIDQTRVIRDMLVTLAEIEYQISK
jgi:hypothetical protein